MLSQQENQGVLTTTECVSGLRRVIPVGKRRGLCSRVPVVCWVASVALMMCLAAPRAYAGGCPPACPPGPTVCPNAAAGVCTYEQFVDKKGGLWCFVCTNESALGNFEWWYDAPGPKPNKKIAVCPFKGGQNSFRYLADPENPRQRRMLVHRVRDGNNSKRVRVHVFDKDLNMGLVIEVIFNNSTQEWEEQWRKPYETLGDIPPLEAPAENATKLALEASAEGPVVHIAWATPDPEPNPTLSAGDSVFIGDVLMSDIVSVDPRYKVSQAPGPEPGIILTATKAVLLNAEDVLLTILRPTKSTLLYAVNEVGVEDFYSSVFQGAPLDGSWSTQPDLADMVGNVSASGELTVPADIIPTVSEWGLIILCLLLMTAGTIVIRRSMVNQEAALAT